MKESFRRTSKDPAWFSSWQPDGALWWICCQGKLALKCLLKFEVGYKESKVSTVELKYSNLFGARK